MQNWTNEEINFLQEKLLLNTKELFLSFTDQYGSDRTYDSVQKKIKKLRDAYSDEPIEDTEDITEQVDNLISLTQAPQYSPSLLEIGAPNGYNKKEKKQEAKDWLEGIVEYSEDIKETLQAQSPQTVQSEKTTLCVVLSDTHYGKHTKWYDLETADERAQSIPYRIYEGALPEIDEVIIILAGDMVEGEDIYPTQSGHIECSAIEQVQSCAESLWKMILTFRELYKCRIRIETCPGNHGRVSKTANERTNWDNVVYHILNVMRTIYGDDDIVVNCNFEPFRTFQVKDKIGMAYHHGVKHTGTSSMREKVAGWIANKKFDFMVHGHWHEWHVGSWLGRFVMANGCMCGPDDLAERMGKEDDARQGYFFVTPGKPVWGFSFVEWPTVDAQ